MQLSLILNALQQIAPLSLAEDWDNVGLLVGDPNRHVSNAMVCLTLTPTNLEEAIDGSAQLVVCHHPIPFRPLNRLTTDTITGRILLKSIEAGIAIYSPHTAWDNASEGINAQLAQLVQLTNVEPLTPSKKPDDAARHLGSGRCGAFAEPTSIDAILERLGRSIPIVQPRLTHSRDRAVCKLGIICGSGGSLVSVAASRGCDAFLTGEATYHQCLEAEAANIAMIIIGHHASESFAMSTFAQLLTNQCTEVSVWASKSDRELNSPI